MHIALFLHEWRLGFKVKAPQLRWRVSGAPCRLFGHSQMLNVLFLPHKYAVNTHVASDVRGVCSFADFTPVKRVIRPVSATHLGSVADQSPSV